VWCGDMQLSDGVHTQAAEFELMKLSNKVRFILAVISGELKINNRKKGDIETDMDGMQYDRIAPAKKASSSLSTTVARLSNLRALFLHPGLGRTAIRANLAGGFQKLQFCVPYCMPYGG